MQQVAELDLAYLPMDQESFAEDPIPHFAAARARHPWLARSSAGYVVNDYTAIREFFHAEARLENPYEGMLALLDAKDTPRGRFQANHILNQSGEAHAWLRRVLNPAFTPRHANRHRPLTRDVISALLDDWTPKGGFDFEEFASYFPITVMCSLIGASPDVIPPLRESLEALGLSASMDRAILPRLQEATIVCDAFVRQLVADREAGRHATDAEDLLDVLIAARDTGGLCDRELYDLLIFLFVAGYDTSKNLLMLAIYEMSRHPEMYARCADDADYCRKVIEETFRFHSTAPSIRVLADDLMFRDVLLRKGSMIYFPINVIGRDPRMADDPERFDPERRQANRPIPFGLGAHLCLGQFIARAQIEEGLHLIARRLRNLRSPGPAGWRAYTGVWGIRGLPVTFDPA